MSLVLYYAPQTRALRALWALEELGVRYEKIKLDLSIGDQKKPDYLSLNPNGKVPTLVVDGIPMFESAAIILFLAERYGVEKGFWPKPNDPTRPTALAWTLWDQTQLGLDGHRWVGSGSKLVPLDQQNAASAAASLADLQADLGILEARIVRSGGHVLSSNFSFADLSLAHTVGFLAMIGIDLLRWPTLVDWLKRCGGRPAFQRALGI